MPRNTTRMTEMAPLRVKIPASSCAVKARLESGSRGRISSVRAARTLSTGFHDLLGVPADDLRHVLVGAENLQVSTGESNQKIHRQPDGGLGIHRERVA